MWRTVLLRICSWRTRSPRLTCREADVADSIACLRYYAGMADKVIGQTLDTYGGDKLVYTLHQPIGVCGQIIPWNYPLQM